MLLVILCYLMANVAYVAVLPLDQIVNFQSGNPVEGFATTFGDTTMGFAGQILLPLLIAASAFGAANGTLFSC